MTSTPLDAGRQYIAGFNNGASGNFVMLDEPLHANITGDSAYLAIPATTTLTVAGQQVTQTGAVFTGGFTSARTAGG